MTNKEFAGQIINKRITAVVLCPECDRGDAAPNDVLVQSLKLSDGTVIELRGEMGYASHTAVTLVHPR